MRIKKIIVTVMITIMTIYNKRKGNNCNKRDLIDF